MISSRLSQRTSPGHSNPGVPIQKRRGTGQVQSRGMGQCGLALASRVPAPQARVSVIQEAPDSGLAGETLLYRM